MRRSKSFGLRLIESLEGRALMTRGIHGMFHRTDVPAKPSFDVDEITTNIPRRAGMTDPNLVNPWGITYRPPVPGIVGGPFWVSDNGTGKATLYDGVGTSLRRAITIPTPPGDTSPSTPTGIVFNPSTTDFLLNGPGTAAQFIFVTEDGTISGWNSGNNAVLKVDHSKSGAVYKGATLATDGAGNLLLYVTNFHDNRVEVYDSTFHRVKSFNDHLIPRQFAPFGITNIGGVLFVTYAKQERPEKEDDQAGKGNGFVDAFDPNSRLLLRVASRGKLNSPWGLTVGLPDFGGFANDLLVGNFGDGRINAFRAVFAHGRIVKFRFDGQLSDSSGKPITIDGLWGLIPGNHGQGGVNTSIYFTAGINGEKDGVLGALTPSEPDL